MARNTTDSPAAPGATIPTAPQRIDGGGTIDGATTINQAILLRPDSVSVFQHLGLDACCGGGLPIAEAARRHGLDPAEVLARLAALPTA